MPFLRPRLKLAVILVLAGELFASGLARWPLTTATVHNALEFQLGQVVIASENWRREGLWARHATPSRSIDQTLPEWSYRDRFWRDYVSLPPLSFLTHFAVVGLIPIDPVLAGKLLAQAMIWAGVLLSAWWLLDVVGAWAVMVGWSFLIWSVPILVWYVDGYFGTTPATIAILLLGAWTLRALHGLLQDERARRFGARHWMTAGVLAGLGALSEWVALFGAAVTGLTCGILAILLAIRRRPQWRGAAALAVAVMAGAAISVAATLLLYASQLGADEFRLQFENRIWTRTGEGSTTLAAHTATVLRQLNISWPLDLVVFLGLALAVCLVWSIGWMVREVRGQDRMRGVLVPCALAFGFGGPLIYLFRLKNLVTIHYWFTGTTVVGFAFTLALVVCIVEQRLFSKAVGSNRFVSRGWHLAMAALVATLAVRNLLFADLPARAAPMGSSSPSTIYRQLGQELPNDDHPLVVADIPDLFGHYPFATMYLRRPIVQLVNRKLVLLATDEPAAGALAKRATSAYVVFDPLLKSCRGTAIPLGAWSHRVPVAACRVRVADLIDRQDMVLPEQPPRTVADLDKNIERFMETLGCCDADEVVQVTRAASRHLYNADGHLVNALRQEHGTVVERLAQRWQAFVGGVQRPIPAPASPSLFGLLDIGGRWYALVVNTGSDPVSEIHAGIALLVDGSRARFTTPYGGRTADGIAPLPFWLMELEEAPSLRSDLPGLTLYDFSHPRIQTRGAVVHWPPQPCCPTSR